MDNVDNQESLPESHTGTQPELPGRKELVWIKRGAMLGHLAGWREGRRGDNLSLSIRERLAANVLALALSQNSDAISPQLLDECSIVAGTHSDVAQKPMLVQRQNVDLAMHANQRIERMPLLFRWWFRRNSAGGNGVTGDDYINALARWDNLKDSLRLSFKAIPVIGLLGLAGYFGYNLGDSDDSVDLRAVEQNAWENNTIGLRTPMGRALVFDIGQRYLDLSNRGTDGRFHEGTLREPVIGFGLRLPLKDGSNSWLPQPPAGSEWAVGNIGGTKVAFPIPATTDDAELRPEVTATLEKCDNGGVLVFSPTSGETVVAETLEPVSPELASNVESGQVAPEPRRDSCP